jgi:hypothetical protein
VVFLFPRQRAAATDTFLHREEAEKREALAKVKRSSLSPSREGELSFKTFARGSRY